MSGFATYREKFQAWILLIIADDIFVAEHCSPDKMLHIYSNNFLSKQKYKNDRPTTTSTLKLHNTARGICTYLRELKHFQCEDTTSLN